MKTLILFGFQGAGKSYLGRKLAEAVGRPFLDTDVIIENRYAARTATFLSCRELYRQWGEEHFREEERQVVRTLSLEEGSILALGGGTLLSLENVRRLEQLGRFVYLDMDYATAQARTFSGALPALYEGGDPRRAFEVLYEARRRHYEEIAATRVTLTKKNEGELLTELISLFYSESEKGRSHGE